MALQSFKDYIRNNKEKRETEFVANLILKTGFPIDSFVEWYREFGHKLKLEQLEVLITEDWTGAGIGATLGSFAGPVGAGIGGLVGGLGGKAWDAYSKWADPRSYYLKQMNKGKKEVLKQLNNLKSIADDAKEVIADPKQDAYFDSYSKLMNYLAQILIKGQVAQPQPQSQPEPEPEQQSGTQTPSQSGTQTPSQSGTQTPSQSGPQQSIEEIIDQIKADESFKNHYSLLAVDYPNGENPFVTKDELAKAVAVYANEEGINYKISLKEVMSLIIISDKTKSSDIYKTYITAGEKKGFAIDYLEGLLQDFIAEEITNNRTYNGNQEKILDVFYNFMVKAGEL